MVVEMKRWRMRVVEIGRIALDMVDRKACL